MDIATYSNVLEYVMSAPYFWQSVGFTVATSMFVGAILYRGDMAGVTKFLIAVSLYFGYVFLTNAFRVAALVGFKTILFPTSSQHIQAWAGNITLLIVTIAYVVGLLLGVVLTKK